MQALDKCNLLYVVQSRQRPYVGPGWNSLFITLCPAFPWLAPSLFYTDFGGI